MFKTFCVKLRVVVTFLVILIYNLYLKQDLEKRETGTDEYHGEPRRPMERDPRPSPLPPRLRGLRGGRRVFAAGPTSAARAWKAAYCAILKTRPRRAARPPRRAAAQPLRGRAAQSVLSRIAARRLVSRSTLLYSSVQARAAMLGGSVLWFRHGLRLHDNPALHAALQDRAAPFFPLFIFDGETAGTKGAGYNRMRYLLESLEDLDGQLRREGGRLLVVRGRPERVLRALWEEFGIRAVCFEQDCEPVWAARDAGVRRACGEAGVACRELVSHTLWEPRAVIRANGGIQPLTYQMFLHTVETIGPPPRPVGDADLRGVRFGTLPARFYTEFTVYDKIPKPEDFGIHAENEDMRMIRWQGGETTALQQMEQRLAVEHETFLRGSYLPTHGSPDLLGPPVSLSPALRFGCLSVRKFYWSIQDLFHRVHRGRLGAAHFITGQLIWREYFYTMSVNNPNYGQMAGNPICLDIPWREPQPGELQRWCEGRTGFPFIDAAMRQLRGEGWLHHAARNAAASFLTRGTLWLSWEHGLRHFLRYLLDADWSVCAGNWMWVSSSAFEALLDASECACPVRLGRRLDPRGEYVRRYVRELARMPLDYIFEPWRAPLEVQERAGCVVGRDYPAPMADHRARAQRNRAAMQELRETLQQKPPPHCCPSSEEEIRQFMWLHEDPQPAPLPAGHDPRDAD